MIGKPDSPLRRRFKRMIKPITPEPAYRLLHTLAAAYDIRSRSWWEPELDLIAYAVRPGDRVVDVGANFGLWTYHLDRAVGRGGRVYAFEPIPYTRGVLLGVSRILRLNRLEVFAVAAGASSERAEFRIPLQDSGALNAGLAHRSGEHEDEADGHERVLVVEIVRVDDVLADVERVSLVKLDIEGGELDALRGAEGLLTRQHPTVVCEVDAKFLARQGQTPHELRGFLASLGYDTFRWIKGPEPRLDPIPEDETLTGNPIFVHPEYRNRLSALFVGHNPVSGEG